MEIERDRLHHAGHQPVKQEVRKRNSEGMLRGTGPIFTNWDCQSRKAKLKGPSSLGSRTSFGAPAHAHVDAVGGIDLLFHYPGWHHSSVQWTTQGRPSGALVQISTDFMLAIDWWE